MIAKNLSSTMSNPRLAGNKTIEILTNAEQGHYGVVAPIVYNLEHILAFTQAAEHKRSPLILQFFPWAVTFSSGLLIHAAAHAARTATVPIALHLDHAQDEAMIRYCADTLPFDSIMVDMSHYDKTENLVRTRELVAYCHERGIATEAEPGRIEGGEDGIEGTEDLEGVLTTVEEAGEFFDTGVDFLAPAFGNVHGEYGAKGPVLDFERLEAIRKVAVERGRRLVVHGTNGFPEDIMRACIRAGVSKINVNKLVLDDYLVFIKEQSAKLPLTRLMEEGVEHVRRLTEWQMDVCMSKGKADV